MGNVIDGKKLAEILCEKIKHSASLIRSKFKIIPSLHVIMVGDNVASELYVKHKEKKANYIGFSSQVHRLSENTTQNEILVLIDDLNKRIDVDGIILQLPLPKCINKQVVLERVLPTKDVDGFTSINLGKIFAGFKDGFIPCTAIGCMHIVESLNVDLKGMNAVIIGASNVVGKPLGHLLLNAGCTVTFLHVLSKNIKEHCSKADLLISAVGNPAMVDGSFVKEGAIVIDVGITRVVRDSGVKIVGDVDFNDVASKSTWITPVPGGVGPMTIACLMKNTMIATCRRNNISFEDIAFVV